MKILVCHNSYRYRGGEDQVFDDEVGMLRAAGHEVLTYQRCNQEIESTRRAQIAAGTIWSRRTYRELRALLQQETPAVVHFHNTFPLISPSAYYAARHEGIPVIQTLHNFRLLCPGGTLLRDGKVCEQCVAKAFATASVRYGCYRQSRSASLVAASMLAAHWRMGTWSNAVSRYIALTDFARDKFIAGGFPADRMVVKPNCVHPDPGFHEHPDKFAVYVGRLSEEKGIRPLLQAWKRLGSSLPLKLAGEGPLEGFVRQARAEGCHVELLGQLTHDQVLSLMGQASIAVCPSICHEGFGRSVIEAFASGPAVVASDLAPLNQLVHDGTNGLLFRSGDADDLAAKIQWLMANDAQWHAFRQQARRDYEAHYTPQRNCEQLISIYEQVQEGPSELPPRLSEHGVYSTAAKATS